MPFTLPDLPYPHDALEPHIDARTMEIHHGKHHKAYIDNANAALEKHPALAARSVEELLRDLNAVPEDIRTVIRNNAGGHANHSLFWTVMKPRGGGAPSATSPRPSTRPSAALTRSSSSSKPRPRRASAAGGPGFRSRRTERSRSSSTPNQDSPLSEGMTPDPGSRRVGARVLPASTRTSAPTTWPRSGTWSTGTKWRAALRPRARPRRRVGC